MDAAGDAAGTDTNRDHKITETEAKIFSAQVK